MRVSALPELQAYPPSFSPPPKAAMEARDFSRVSLHTYGIKEGDKMYLAPEDRILIW